MVLTNSSNSVIPDNPNSWQTSRTITWGKHECITTCERENSRFDNTTSAAPELNIPIELRLAGRSSGQTQLRKDSDTIHLESHQIPHQRHFLFFVYWLDRESSWHGQFFLPFFLSSFLTFLHSINPFHQLLLSFSRLFVPYIRYFSFYLSYLQSVHFSPFYSALKAALCCVTENESHIFRLQIDPSYYERWKEGK